MTLNYTGDGFRFNPGGGIGYVGDTDTDDAVFQEGVAAPVPCTLTCPANIGPIHLAGGECEAIVDYDAPVVAGDCQVVEYVVSHITQNQQLGVVEDALDCDARPVSHYRVYTNTLGIPLQIQSVTTVAYGGIFGCYNGSVQVIVHEYTGVAGGPSIQFSDFGAVLGSSAVTSLFCGAFTDVAVNAVVQPGDQYVVEQKSVSGDFFIIAGNNGGETDPSYIYDPACGDPLTAAVSYASIGFGNIAVYQVVNALTPTSNFVDPIVVQTSGIASGGNFPIGTTTNCFSLVNPTNPLDVVDNCCFDVTVQEYPTPIHQLNCNDLVQVSLDDDCSACLGADDVLEGGPYGCYADYIVEVDRTPPYGNGPWSPACFGPSDIGKTYQVRVTDPEQNPVNRCWGSVKIEDKIPPVLTCEDFTLTCNSPIDPYNTVNLPSYIGNAYWSDVFYAPINDFQTTTTDINVNYGGTNVFIRDINVDVWIVHSYLSDLTVTLTSPSGTTIVLKDGDCGSNDDAYFGYDDEAACTGDDCDFASTFTFTYEAPSCYGYAPMSTFDGENPNGDWTLSVTDAFGLDEGYVYFWGLDISTYGRAPAGFTVPDVYEGCCFDNLTYQDIAVVPLGCDEYQCDDNENCIPVSQRIDRKWTARDCSGNTSTCIQHLYFERPNIYNYNDVTVPPDYDGIDAPYFECTDNAYPTPEWIEQQGLQGWPWVFGYPEGCNINWGYEDLVIHVCDGTYKVRREWTVIDWCVGDGFTYNQIIKVVDNQGPTLVCPTDYTVSVDPFSCCAYVNLPDILISDNCSSINNISGMVVTHEYYTGEVTGMHTFGGSIVTGYPGDNAWDLEVLGAYGWTPCLPQGTHTVTYMAEDDCGNVSSCTFNLTVRDYIPPVAACDETTTVGIGVDDPFDCYGPAGPNGTPAALDACEGAGVTWVKATTFDDGSYDQCHGVHFTVRRMAPYSDCINGLNQVNGHPACDDQFGDPVSEYNLATNESDSIKFYCCEVGTIQTVILRVYQTEADGTFSVGPDGGFIWNECMIQVEVQDKLKPVCVPPANVTVTCEDFDPSLWLYGKASVWDNCCLDETKVYQGQCGLTHSASYTNFDTICNKGTIRRTFRAFDCHGQSSSCQQNVVVRYNQNYYVKFPDDQFVTICDGPNTFGEPTFYGEDCELLGVSYEDALFTVVPDACFKIERTWKIINWCTYNPDDLCVLVPNPNPDVQPNTANNRKGPIVSACGTIGPWAPTVTKLVPGGPTVNFCDYWEPDGLDVNCYIYKQIIKVIDNQPPVAECPASPVTICDLTPNDPQLWHRTYWWDNGNQSHDLCEAPSDICITATDLCSGANINIKYQLFLDLDGDGVMETLINSVHAGRQPGDAYALDWDNVWFGNFPNAAAGERRGFDDRPVPQNQKWGFTIQQTVSGVNKTACVKFNTEQAQTTYVTPQLPHGTHKIKWFISDGCGNETVCEYTIIIKDCKAPTVVCLNGLSVNIMPTGMIQLWATDFLQYAEDNCTLNPYLKYGIRKCGTGTGFPADSDGNPITNVVFTCDELGTQCVELWAIDLAGNADYCETYVIVQDNAGNCGASGTVNVSGALKTEGTDGVEEGNVNVTGSVNFAPPFSYFDLSDNSGVYGISNSVPVASSMTISPVKDDNPLNGVTTYDLVLISKHILGIEPLGSAYKMIAADANKSNSITTFDIVELRKLILGIYQELPNNTSWRFVEKAHVFANPANPFQGTIPENISVGQAMTNQMDENFVGVKIGDVNNTAVANSLMVSDDRSVGTLLFDVNDRDVKAGEEFEVAFKASDKTQGYQMTLNLNGLAVSEIVGGDNVTANNFGVFADAMTVSVDGADAFTVKFRAAKAGKLSEMMSVSSRITKAEAYSVADGRLDVALRFDGKTIAGVGFELYQNQPNPFVNKTFVGFHLPEATTATLTVYDETGRVVFTQKGDFAKGYNAISLDRALLNTTGVLYYTLETATDSATKKMIQAK